MHSTPDNDDVTPAGMAPIAPKVMLTDTTRYSSAPRLAVSFVKAGIDVSALCPMPGHPLLKIRRIQQVLPYSGLNPLKSLLSAIEATRPDFIIPCDDRGVRHLHELHTRCHLLGESGNPISALIERSLGPPQSYATVSGRYALLKIAAEEGLHVPEMRLVSTLEDLNSWRVSHQFPWVLKSDGTSGGRGVRIANTPEQAERLLVKMTRMPGAARAIKQLIVNRDSFWLRPWWNRSRPPVIVQSYIHGRPANCAFVCWKGKVLAGLDVEVVSTQGATGPATIVRLVDNHTMTLAAERIASRLGLSGFFGLDFVIEDGSGLPYLIEMNPRSTPLCHLQLGKNRDLIAGLCSQLSAQPLRETPPVTLNDLIAYFPQAWQHESELMASSFQDVPWEEPDLIQELLHPWPDRSLVVRLFNYLYPGPGTSEQCTFAQAFPDATTPPRRSA